MGGQIFIFWPPIWPPIMGGQPKISRKLSSARKRTENFWPSFENPDSLWFFKCLFPFFFTFLLIFYVNFPHFLWLSAYFHGGSDPPDPPPFFRWGVRNFFHGGSGSWNGGSDSFLTPWPPIWPPWGKTLLLLLSERGFSYNLKKIMSDQALNFLVGCG